MKLNSIVNQDPTFDDIWSRIQEKLGNIFRVLADICLEKGTFTKTEHERYFVSGMVC